MSIHRLVSLDAYCDGCHRTFGEASDEPANAPGIGKWTSSPREARADMKTYGWTKKRVFHRTLDFCPECASKLREMPV